MVLGLRGEEGGVGVQDNTLTSSTLVSNLRSKGREAHLVVNKEPCLAKNC